MTENPTTTGREATTDRPPVGDWLVVPAPAVERGWRWARIVARIPGDGPVRYRVRWVGNDRDSVVTPPPDHRIESAARWPQPPGGAIGLWPDPAGPGHTARDAR